MEDNSLTHFGVLGMKWGRRKNEYPGVPAGIQRAARKDARRHVEAEMFYGETAGTKRKLLKAEIDSKKKNVPGYKDVFEKEILNVDTKKAAEKAFRDRTSTDLIDKGRRLAKNVLNVTGPLSVAVASALYYKNKPMIDNFISDQMRKFLYHR